MGRTLDLVGHGDRKILKRDPALSGRINQKLVRSQTELAGPAAEIQQRRRRQEGQFSSRSCRNRSRNTPPFSASALYAAGKSGTVTSLTPGATSSDPAPPTTR
jgi:hypothetical protein